MRRIITSEMMSLDGFLAEPDDEIDWFVWSREMERYDTDSLRGIDTLLFGRVTYEGTARYWTTAQPKDNDPELIGMMNDLQKVVLSRTLEEATWNNPRIERAVTTASAIDELP